MALIVKHAVYGALPGGNGNAAQAFDVTAQLQGILNRGEAGAGIAVINNASFGDPSPNNVKHFGAVVNRNGSDFYFACNEGQTIDFNHDGGVSHASPFTVQFAVYGALPGGSLSSAEAFDVTALLQQLLGQTNVIECNNATFGGDPSPNNQKHFAAVITRGGRNYPFACLEGQTIDFAVGG